MNKIMTALYIGLTEEEVMERLDYNDVKYDFFFGVNNEESTIIYDKYIVKFIGGFCVKVLDK